jgi:hypothetical protein
MKSGEKIRPPPSPTMVKTREAAKIIGKRRNNDTRKVSFGPEYLTTNLTFPGSQDEYTEMV